jgi:5'-deoxynucleotidase YfbR-like HD superfamily hydrolase
MSLVHDMGESIIGDFTPHCGVTEIEKYNLETAAVAKLAGLISPDKGKEIRDLFQVTIVQNCLCKVDSPHRSVFRSDLVNVISGV